MQPGDFYRLTIYETGVLFSGYFEKQNASIKWQGELARLQTFYLFNIHLSEKDKFKKPEELWRFSWEEEPEQEKPRMVTPEENAEYVRKMLQHLK